MAVDAAPRHKTPQQSYAVEVHWHISTIKKVVLWHKESITFSLQKHCVFSTKAMP
jgi:hypothetical protein